MTIEQMRALVSLPEDATDAAVVAAYAALIDDGLPQSIDLVEPVTVELARLQCGLDDAFEDELIAAKISAARELVEELAGRVIAQQTLVAHFRCWGTYLEILKRPIISVDAIAYEGIDGDGLYEDGAYSLGAFPFRIYPGSGGFPQLRVGGGITVAFTAGYDAGEAPKRLIEATLVLTGGMMKEREGGYQASIDAAKSLVRGMRARRL